MHKKKQIRGRDCLKKGISSFREEAKTLEKTVSNLGNQHGGSRGFFVCLRSSFPGTKVKIPACNCPIRCKNCGYKRFAYISLTKIVLILHETQPVVTEILSKIINAELRTSRGSEISVSLRKV